jgi:hypothetical protein
VILWDGAGLGILEHCAQSDGKGTNWSALDEGNHTTEEEGISDCKKESYLARQSSQLISGQNDIGVIALNFNKATRIRTALGGDERKSPGHWTMTRV